MASIKYRDASYGDLAEISHMLALAFRDDGVWGDIMHPHRHTYPDDLDLWFLQRVRVAFWDYRWKWLVAYDTDSKGKEFIVGCAQWSRKGKHVKSMDLWWFDPRNLLQPLSVIAMKVHARIWPNRAGDPNKVDLFERVAPFYKHLWSGDREESWYLELLGVHPDYQGKGIGNKLVQWGLDQAAKEGVCASVMSASGKDAFYQKCGFDMQDGRGGMGDGNPMADLPGGNIWWKMPEPKAMSGHT